MTDPEAVASTAVDISEDGRVVLGIYSGYQTGTQRAYNQNFTWSAENGVRNIGSSDFLDAIQFDAACMSGDGFAFVMNREVQNREPGDAPDGGSMALYGMPEAGGLWGGFDLTNEGSDIRFFAAPTAISRHGTLVAGHLIVPNTMLNVRPSVWMPGSGVLQIAPGVVGYAKAASPHGTLAGGGNDDAGTGFLWNPEAGYQNMVVTLQQYDEVHGTHFMDVFDESGGISNVTAITQDDQRIVGTAGNAFAGLPYHGFVLDLPPDWPH